MFDLFSDFKFANPWLLYALFIIPILIVWYYFKNKKQQNFLVYSDTKLLANLSTSWKVYGRHLLFVFRLLAIAFLIIALARPQSSSSKKNITTEGIDIVLAMDVSTSMLAEDFKPNRIESAKKNAIEFIKNRPNDRIGLVIFSGESYTQCPVTIDHKVLVELIENIKTGVIMDGTAIGQGLATAVSRLKDSKAKSKVIILLSDGVNNSGAVSPETAAEIAANFGIRVYTIGIGTRGMAPFPVQTPFGKQYQNVEVEIDEVVMKKISDLTAGYYFRATGNKALNEIYKKIDKLEKTKVNLDIFTKKTEEFYPYALAAFVFFALEMLAKFTILRIKFT